MLNKTDCECHVRIYIFTLCFHEIVVALASDEFKYDPHAFILDKIEKDELSKDNWAWQWTSEISVVPNNAHMPIISGCLTVTYHRLRYLTLQIFTLSII